MPLHSDTLFTLTGRVRDARPGLGEEQYRTFLNDAIRNVINKRVYWTDLRRVGIIAVPNAVVNGAGFGGTGATTTPGSNLIAGVGTAWPVNDIVNTTLAEPVTEPGATEVSLASIAGINLESVLYIDAGTPNAEAVPVYRINGYGSFGTPTIVTRFKFPHPINATVWQSSLVGRQWRAGYNYPIFTILGVPDAATLLLDNAWGGLAITNAGYTILKMYYTLGFHNVRKVIAVIDQEQGVPLDATKTQQELNVTDPQRTDNSDPLCFVSAWPNINLNAQWEIWPAPCNARQIAVLATLQWPEMITPDDMPPPFLEPTIFSDMATSRALKIRQKPQDPYYDPKLAMEYERTANIALEDALNGDEARAVQDYQTQLGQMLPTIGANSQFALSHTMEQLAWNF